MPRSLRAALALLAFTALALAGCGNGGGPAEAEGTLRVLDATVDRPANPSQASLRFVIDNGTGTDDELIGVASPVAGAADVHRSEVDERGVATMESVEGLSIPARSKVTFEPGGLHVMLKELAEPLEVDQTFDVELTFARAGTRTVEVRVVEPGSDPADEMEHDHG